MNDKKLTKEQIDKLKKEKQNKLKGGKIITK